MIKYDDKLKKSAIELRKRGLSYNEIRKKIPVAKSTLSLWLKSVLLSPEHKERLYTKQIQILSLGPKSQKERRGHEVNELIKRSINEIHLPISQEAMMLMGAALYWAEGSKGKRFELTNSDPHLILFMTRWIEVVLNIKAKDIKARLNIYPQQNEVKIKKFWSELTGIPVKSFGKSYVKPISSGYKKNNLYYGTIRLEVPRGTDKMYRVFAWIKAVLQDIAPEVELVQNKWQSLRKVNRPVNLQ